MPAQISKDFYYKVDGMKCHRCLYSIKKYLEADFDFKSIKIDLSKKLLSFQGPEGFSEKGLLKGLSKLGFKAEPVTHYESAALSSKKDLIRLGVAGACAGNVMLASYALYAGAEQTDYKALLSWLSFFLYLPSFVFSGFVFFENSYRAIKLKKPSIDTPLAMALLVGTGISFKNLYLGSDQFYFDSLAVLIFLILLSRYFVSKVAEKYLSPVTLADVFVEEKYQVKRGEENLMLFKEEIAKGDLVRLESEQFIPVDGVLKTKEASFDLSLFSGEALPVELKEYDQVFAGSKVYTKVIFMEAQSSLKDSRISDLVKGMNQFDVEKTPFIQATDKLSNWFTFGIMGVSFLFLLGYSWISFEEGLNRVLALMVIACPCALAIISPLTLSLGIRRAFLEGVLIKKIDALEKLAKVKEVVLDKTGTLVHSSLDCTGWSPVEPTQKEKNIIYALEEKSEHPLAKAILRNLKGSTAVELKEFQEQAGLGVSAFYEGDFYELKKSEDPSRGLVGFYKNEALVTTAQFQSSLFDNVSEDLKWLKSKMDKVHLLTGDSSEQTQKMIDELGVSFDQVHVGLSPEEKKNFVKSIEKKSPHSSLFMGDGINDSLAIQVAGLGVSAFNSSLASFKASDLHLNSVGLGALKKFFLVSQSTMASLKKALIFSVLYNIVFGVLALSGMIQPLAAAILMPLSTITLVLIVIFSMQQLKKGARA